MPNQSRTPNLLQAILPATLLVAALALAAPASAATGGPFNGQSPASAPQAAQTGGTATQPPANRPTRVRANLSGFDLSAQTGRSPNQTSNGAVGVSRVVMAPNQIGGASRGLDGSATLYAPHLGKAYTTRPTFYWNASDAPANSAAAAAKTPVKFLLVNSSGDTIYEATLTADHLEYPAEAPALAPGEVYRWSVAAASSALDPTTPPVAFLIVGGPDRAAIAQELEAIPGTGLESDQARAKVFVDHRLWYDAIATYTSLIAAHPADAALRQDRAELYSQLPVTQPLATQPLATDQH